MYADGCINAWLNTTVLRSEVYYVIAVMSPLRETLLYPLAMFPWITPNPGAASMTAWAPNVMMEIPPRTPTPF